MIRTELEGPVVCPRVYCDRCGERIDDHNDAIVQLHANGRYRIVHRLCDRRREGAHGWYSLSDFLVYLLHNLRLTPERVAEIEKQHFEPFWRC